MRPQKVLDEDMLEGLAKIFRSKGYEGASLTDLAEATGLKKASLYHRFPHGKQEMAEAVFTYYKKWVADNVFNILLDDQQNPEIRLKKGIDQIRCLYNNGNEICILRAMSMQSGIDLFEKEISNGMEQWLGVFNKIGLAFGLTEQDAENIALQTLVQIQGSLIVSKGLNDKSIFEKTLQKIEMTYLNKSA